MPLLIWSRPLLVNIDRFGGGQIKVGSFEKNIFIFTARAREKEVTQENAAGLASERKRRRRRIGKVMGSRDLDLSPIQ